MTSYSVSAGGTKYGPVVVVITDGTGSGATATISSSQISGGVIQSATLVSGGTGYSGSPTATIYGGGGSSATASLTVSSGVITAINITAGGSGYSATANTVTIAAPSLTVTGTLTSNSKSVTGISSTAGLHVGMLVLGTGSNSPNWIATVNSGTAITLGLPATIAGSTALTVVGKRAMATLTIANGVITAVNVFTPGTGYSGTGPSTSSGITIAGPGSGATITSTISNAIVSIPITNPGSGYTSQPSIGITDDTGTGATAIAAMAGVQPTDVVTYSASDSWIVSAAARPAVPSMRRLLTSTGRTKRVTEASRTSGCRATASQCRQALTLRPNATMARRSTSVPTGCRVPW